MALERRTQRVGVREPGQHGHDAMRRESLRWAAAFVLLGVVPLLGVAAGVWAPALIALELALIVAIVLLYRQVTTGLARRARGVRGEQKVGRILDGLAASGWLTLHDVSTGRGNIDHIAVGPSGVFAIETKSQRGRILVSRVSRRWLSQAYAERRSLERLTGIRVDPLLVFSDAYLVGQPVSRTRGVLVLPARMLAGHLATRQKILTAEQVHERYARIVSALSAG